MLGERIGAPRALDWGLINQVWPDTELTARAEELAVRMANGPTRSYAGIKRELNAWTFAQLETALELEKRWWPSSATPPTPPRDAPPSSPSGPASSAAGNSQAGAGQLSDPACHA